MIARTKGPKYRLDDRFHAGKIVTAGDDDGMAVATFDVNVPEIIQVNIVEAANGWDALREENERLRSDNALYLAALRQIADAEYGTDTPRLRATARIALDRPSALKGGE